MYQFDKTRIDLAREFRANPYGEHSPDLQYLLNLMRRPTLEPFHVLLVGVPAPNWRIALMDPRKGNAPIPIGPEFADLTAAEWHVFKLRWSKLAGEQLRIGLDD